MSDKEPRRRRKRKDSQPPRKEDVHATNDQFFMPSKSDIKDSDQELEEEIVIPTHQPSVFAKFVFVLLFSGLVISLSFIFISLHGTDRGDVDIFNGHSEEIEVPHDEHDLHELNDHVPPDEDLHDHDEETSDEESFQENIADFFPSIGSILSFNKEPEKEAVEESISDTVEEQEASNEQLSELHVSSHTDDYSSSANEDTIGDVVEDTTGDDFAEDTTREAASEDNEPSTEAPVFPELYSDALEEPEPESFHPAIPHDEAASEQDSKESPQHEAEVDEQNDDEIFDNKVEYSDSDYVTEAEISDSVTESYTTSLDEDISPATHAVDEEEEDEQLIGNQDMDSDELIDASIDNTDEEFSYYEKQSLTNDDDFKIRDQLDDLDKILQKEFIVDDNDDDDEEDDDDEYDEDEEEGDQGAGDEFDFWQF